MKAIKAAQKNGHLIFLCTGRNPAMLAPVLALGFKGAVAPADRSRLPKPDTDAFQTH